MIDGERFYFPYGIGMKEFFLMNEYEFFPRVSKIPYEYSVCFFYERDSSLEDLGQSLGSYRFSAVGIGVLCVHLSLFLFAIFVGINIILLKQVPLLLGISLKTFNNVIVIKKKVKLQRLNNNIINL